MKAKRTSNNKIKNNKAKSNNRKTNGRKTTRKANGRKILGKTNKKSMSRNDVVKRQRIIAIIVLIIILALVIRTIVSCATKDSNVIEIPKGCGTYATREWDLNYYECADGSNQHKVDLLWHKEGTEDKKGFQKLYDRYLIACTDTFGEVGDKIDFYMSNGTILHCIIYDNKSREKTFYDNKPANKWGHDEGRVVLEFVGSAKLGTSPYKKLGLRYEHTVKAVRGKNIFD